MYALCAAIVTGCGFFNPENPPDPLWGIWVGPYPTTISTQADSARWVFASDGIYLFYALAADGELLAREVGYYSAEGFILVLSADPAGQIEREELTYALSEDETTLTLVIRGGTFVYRRAGGRDEADLWVQGEPW